MVYISCVLHELYMPGRAWKRSTSGKRGVAARAFGHLHELYIYGLKKKE